MRSVSRRLAQVLVLGALVVAPQALRADQAAYGLAPIAELALERPARGRRRKSRRKR